MAKTSQRVRRPADAPVGLAESIAHLVHRIERGDPGGLFDRLQDLVSQCLRTNQSIVLQLAAERVARESVGAADCLKATIAYASQNLIRRAENGRPQRYALFAIPVSFSGYTSQPMALPAALPEVAPIRDELIRRGAPADGLIVSPWLHDPDVLAAMDPAAILRLLHQLMPFAPVAADRIADPLDVAWPVATPLAAAQEHVVERTLLGVCVQAVDAPPFFAVEPAGAPTLENCLATWLGAQVGLEGHILSPLLLDDALAFVRHGRLARQLLRNVTLALLDKGIAPETTCARLNADVGFPEKIGAWINGRHGGARTLEVPLNEVPFELTGLTVQILSKEAGEGALPLHEETLIMPPGLDPEAVLDGVILALLSIGIAPPPECRQTH